MHRRPTPSLPCYTPFIVRPLFAPLAPLLLPLLLSACGSTGLVIIDGNGDDVGDAAGVPQDSDAGADAAPPFDAGPFPPEGYLAPTRISQRGKILFQDDFEGGALKSAWTIESGTWITARAEGSQDRRLTGHADNASDPARIRVMVPLDRSIVQFTFVTKKTGGFGLTLNARILGPPGDQHLLAVRELHTIEPRQVHLHELSGWGPATEKKLLRVAAVTLPENTAHVGLLEVVGPDIFFTIDGQKIVSGTTTDQSATPKNELVLQAFGTDVTFDDITIWEALQD